MQNIIIFGITVLGWYAVWFLCYFFIGKRRGFQYSIKDHFVIFLVLALLCMPFNINGNIYTIIGNGSAEKNMYAFWSVYQKAEQDTNSIIGFPLVVQKAGNDAVLGFGGGIQRADNTVSLSAVTIQHAKHTAHHGFGVSLYQHGGICAIMGIGINFYQRAGLRAKTEGSMSFYQATPYYSRSFSVASDTKPDINCF